MTAPGTARSSFATRIALLTVVLAALLVPFGGSASLDRAEPYFMDAARAMVEGGDWLVPYYRDQPFFDKPILMYWLIAAAFRLLGCSPEVARLVPALLAIATLLVTVALTVIVAGRRAALFAGAILATTLPFVSFGRIAMADMLMTLCSTAAVTLAVLAWQNPARSALWLPALGTTLGLGFAAKGPIAVLLPGLAIAALAWHRRRQTWPLALWPAVAATALFTVCACGWFVAIYFRLGTEPLSWFFLRENLQRFSGASYDADRSPFYYLVTYLAQGAPWSLFFPLAAWRVLRRRIEPVAAWLPLALLLMLVPLTVSRGKIDYYLLPLYPLAAVLIGTFFVAPWDRRAAWWVRVACGLLGVGALLATSVAALQLPEAWLPSSAWRAATAATAIVSGLGLLIAAWRPTPARVAWACALPAASLFGLYLYVWAPAFHARQPNRAIVARVERELALRPDVRLALCADPARVHRDLIFRTPIKTLETCQLWGLTTARDPFLLLLRETEWQSLRTSPRLRVVGSFLFIPTRALGPRGVLMAQQPRRLVLVANFPTTDPAARRINRRWRRGGQ